MLDKIARKLLRKSNEFITLPIAVLIMLVSTYVGNKLGIYVHGVEVFQKLIIAFVFVLIVNVLVRILFKPVFPKLYRYMDEDNEEVKGWKPLTVKERIFLAFGLFALFFWGIVRLASSL